MNSTTQFGELTSSSSFYRNIDELVNSISHLQIEESAQNNVDANEEPSTQEHEAPSNSVGGAATDDDREVEGVVSDLSEGDNSGDSAAVVQALLESPSDEEVNVEDEDDDDSDPTFGITISSEAPQNLSGEIGESGDSTLFSASSQLEQSRATDAEDDSPLDQSDTDIVYPSDPEEAEAEISDEDEDVQEDLPGQLQDLEAAEVQVDAAIFSPNPPVVRVGALPAPAQGFVEGQGEDYHVSEDIVITKRDVMSNGVVYGGKGPDGLLYFKVKLTGDRYIFVRDQVVERQLYTMAFCGQYSVLVRKENTTKDGRRRTKLSGSIAKRPAKQGPIPEEDWRGQLGF